MKMSGLDLERLKDAFTTLVGQAEPSVLPAFLLWVDIKVAEYKTNGYMYSDPSSRYEGPWLRFAVDTVKYKLGDKKPSNQTSYHSMSSPDTTVQTEALELTKTPEKKHVPQSVERDVTSYTAISKDAIYSNSPAKSVANHHVDTAYPKDASYPRESSLYSSHHSPVYGTEASGIINLSVKSSQASQSNQEPEIRKMESDASQPLKLTLKVPSVYNAASPVKANSVENSPVKPDTHPTSYATSSSASRPDGYSSLRSLLQATKYGDLPTASLLTSQMTSHQITSSPVKSDNDSCASSPGPSDLETKDHKENDCPYCGKTFQYRSSYRRHLKIHQGVYTHICAACSRKFTRKEHFVRHKCNRKPNIPNRSASRVELNPNAIPAGGKLPVPKVAFPPNLDEQLGEQHSPMSHDEMMNTSATMEEDSNPALVIDEDAPKANESRRKKSQPRKVIPVVPDDCKGNSFMADIDEDMNDLMEAYDSPVGTPETTENAQNGGYSSPNDDHPSSPEDLSQAPAKQPSEFPGMYPAQDRPAEVLPYNSQNPLPSQMPCAQLPSSQVPPPPPTTTEPSSLPVELAPKEGMGADTISTATGTYQIEQVQQDEDTDKCIKVTKQSNYLKLRKEAQLINGQLCFICPHCNKVFHRSSNFSRHMRIHRGVYSYICPSCNRGFYRKEHFQKHKCARKSMSRIWSRKTKLDMEVLPPGADGEKENLMGEGLEEGIDLSSDVGSDDLSGDEGALVVDESAGEEEAGEQQVPFPQPQPYTAVPMAQPMEHAALQV